MKLRIFTSQRETQMAYYEMVILYRQDLSQNQVDTHVETVINYIKENDGTISRQEYWGLRTIAYKIRKNRKAHYMLLNIDCHSDVITEIDRQIKLDDNIIRHMVLRTDDLITEPSVMVRNDSSHEEDNTNNDDDKGEQ